MKQLFPTSQALEIVSEPPVALEFIAPVAGGMVGFMGWVVHHEHFVGWYYSLAYWLEKWVTFPREFDSVYAFLNVTFALNHAVAVGMAVGCISRWYPYRLTPLAMLLTFALKAVHDFGTIMEPSPRKPYEVWWAGVLLLLIYSLGPLLGASIGQRIQARLLRAVHPKEKERVLS